MRHVIVGAPGKNGRIVILNDDVKTAREIASGSCIESDNSLFAQKTMRILPARGRAASLWITAAFLATTWASETQGFPEARHAQADALAKTQHAIAARNVDFGGTAGDRGFETVQASRFGGKSVLIAQATTGDTEELQKALEQEHRRAELLTRELTIARHLEILLTPHKARAESARFNQVSESEYAELRKSLQQERDQLKQASESGAAELCKSLQGDRADRLEQDLAAAKRDVETQTALATKANDDAAQLKKVAESGSAELKRSLQLEQDRAEALAQDLSMARTTIYAYEAQARRASDQAANLKQAAESSAAELGKSLQQERERAAQLQQDLAAARREVETALAAKETTEATQLKQFAENGAAGLKQSLQQEHDRAESLAQELSMTRTKIYAYEAQARKDSDQATDLNQGAESGTAELRKSLQQERERAERLEQDLAAARRDVEAQTALAAKANEDATQLKQVAEVGSAELKRSLQQEHDKAEALAQDLSMTRTKIYAYEAQTPNASDRAAGLKQAEESSAAWLRKSLVQEWERKARLQQELAAARRDVETQTALAAKAGAEAARLRQVAENGSAELKRSLQQERDRGARLERELVSERKAKAAPAVSAVVTAGQVMQDKQVGPDAPKPVAADQATVAKAGTTAQAKQQCSVAIPSNPHGHWWSYRLIDGRKCWYEGKPMLSKSLLEWPKEASAQPRSSGEVTSAVTEKPDNPLDSQAWAPKD
jgi:hypothetical protein